MALPGSVTDEQDVQNAVATMVQAFGRLDILVNRGDESAYVKVLTDGGILNEHRTEPSLCMRTGAF